VGSPAESPHGAPTMRGMVLTRNRSSHGRRSASAAPRASTTTVSWAPQETDATTGTPVRTARRTNPVRPPKSMRSRSAKGRNDSWSPPGYTMTAASAASARSTLAQPASNAPARAKVAPTPGMDNKAVWNNP